MMYNYIALAPPDQPGCLFSTCWYPGPRQNLYTYNVEIKSNMKRYTILLLFLMLYSCLSLPVRAGIDRAIYLRGAINNWAAKDIYRFRPTSDPDVVYLCLNHLEGEFKIADTDWSKYNFGGANHVSSEKLKVGPGEYQCVGGGANFLADKLDDITLVFNNHTSYSPVLTIIKTADFNLEDYKAIEKTPFYLIGDLHGLNWDVEECYRFISTFSPGIYSLQVEELYGNFKIADVAQSLRYGGVEYTSGSWLNLVSGGGNIETPHLVNATLTLDTNPSSGPRLQISGTPYSGTTLPSGIYLMSKMNDSDWTARPQYEFRHTPGSDIHTLEVKTLYDKFKFADPKFASFDYGTAEGPGCKQIDSIGTYSLKSRGGDFAVAPMLDVILTIDLSDKKNPKLFISKNPYPDTSWKENFTLAYAEEFNGDSLNENRWLPYSGEADWDGALSIFTPREENIRVEDGALSLITRREDYGGYSITSGGVRSYQRFVYRYGRLDIRMMQPPTNNGLCTGLWLVGYHYMWPMSGEIDILEQGHGDDIEQGNTPYYFFSGTPCGPASGEFAYSYGRWVTTPYSVQDGQYHLYTMFWDKDRLLFYLDYDKYPDSEPYYAQIIRRDFPEDPYHCGNYFHHPYFIILHMGAQQSYPQNYVVTPDDVTALNDENNHQVAMKIDYVRLYQQGNPEDILEYLVPGDDPSGSGVVSPTQDSNGIAGTTDSDEIHYFDMFGKEVNKNARGVIIRRQGSSSLKIINL